MDSCGPTTSNACRKLLAFIFLQMMVSTIFFAYFRILKETKSGTSVSILQPPPPKVKSSGLTILLWTWPFGSHVTISKCSELLGIPDCYITDDRKMYQKADGVIIHHRDVCWSPKALPQARRPHLQRWIWLNLESPSHSPNLGFMNNHFNFTMSYRKDSDIFTPYGWMDVLKEHRNFTIPPKSKLVAWVVSNWNPSSRRVKYYQELKQHIQVDVYGHQHLPLPRDKLQFTVSQYKFYLAFENSVHEDYITEKLWKNAFHSSAVPVVCGPPRKNYERFVPPDSFIHIDDFSSAKELADFLHELDKNETRYQRYFQWRTWLEPTTKATWGFYFCKACKALQTTTPAYRVVPELSAWFR